MASEITKQKAEFLQYKENTERKTTDTLLILNKENESVSAYCFFILIIKNFAKLQSSDSFQLRARIKQLEDETETAKATISTLRKELDHLTLSHSQILVENTKLTNDKLRLEQDIRKLENRYDVAVRSLHDKFSKEVSGAGLVHDESVPRCVSLLIRNVTSPYRYAISIRSTIRIEQECKNSKR